MRRQARLTHPGHTTMCAVSLFTADPKDLHSRSLGSSQQILRKMKSLSIAERGISTTKSHTHTGQTSRKSISRESMEFPGTYFPQGEKDSHQTEAHVRYRGTGCPSPVPTSHAPVSVSWERWPVSYNGTETFTSSELSGA